MKRKHKKYSKPKRPFDKSRINEEAILKKEYGLKNKREIWKADSQIKSIREKAKRLIGSSEEEQKALFQRLRKKGLKVNSIADVLSLDKKDYLNRRLQTIVVRKKLATTSKSARQLIVHKKILVNGKIVDSPSYIVPIDIEDKISLKEKKKKTELNKKIPEQENKEELKEEPKEKNDWRKRRF